MGLRLAIDRLAGNPRVPTSGPTTVRGTAGAVLLNVLGDYAVTRLAVGIVPGTTGAALARAVVYLRRYTAFDLFHLIPGKCGFGAK